MAQVAFSLTFEGSQEVPARATDAFGTGLVVFDTASSVASYVWQVSGLDFGPVTGQPAATETTADDVTGFHYHSAVRGVNAPIVFDVPVHDIDDVTVVRGPGNTWTVSGAWEPGDPANTSIDSFAAALAAAAPGTEVALYGNVHSTTFPGGEIRAQWVGFERQERDFNDDGNADILWRNDNGTVHIWQLDSAAVTAAADAGSLDPTTDILGTGDFGGDGRSDILVQAADGTVSLREMDGATVLAVTEVGVVDPAWQLQGTGDLNADSMADAVWRNADGTVRVWLMDGAAITAFADAGSADASWAIEGIGDFGGDGRSDILWRNDNGAVHLWQMNGTGVVTTGDVGFADASWQIGGVGDFGGDGRSDILWRNDSGAVHLWQLNGTALVASGDIGFADPTWHIGGVADVGGDGDSDILWRNDNGAVDVWQMAGGSVAANTNIGFADASWTLVPTDDTGPGPTAAASSAFAFDDLSAEPAGGGSDAAPASAPTGSSDPALLLTSHAMTAAAG